jgi:DNA-binding transcriptional LysR family regulator
MHALRPTDLSKLRLSDVFTFVAVTRTGSLSAAARELKVTTSQVSKAIGRMERVFGVVLLQRSTRGVRPSDDQSPLVGELMQIAERLNEFTFQPSVAEAPVRIAAEGIFLQKILPGVVKRLPDARFRAMEMRDEAVAASLSLDTFDIALTTGSANLPRSWMGVDAGYLRYGLFAAPIRARALHPGPLTPASVRSMPFISLVAQGHADPIQLEDHCPLRRSERNVAHQASSLQLAIPLAARCDAVVFAPALAASEQVATQQLTELAVHGWDVRRPVRVVCSAGRTPLKLFQTVVEEVQTALGELQHDDSARAS